MKPFEFLVLALAVYRLALMVTKEAGPGWVFKRLRGLVRRKAPKESHMDEGISCQFCMSMQIAIVVATTAHFWWDTSTYQIGAYALALSATAIMCNQVFTKG